jgi:hypothetical protein
MYLVILDELGCLPFSQPSGVPLSHLRSKLHEHTTLPLRPIEFSAAAACLWRCQNDDGALGWADSLNTIETGSESGKTAPSLRRKEKEGIKERRKRTYPH